MEIQIIELFGDRRESHGFTISSEDRVHQWTLENILELESIIQTYDRSQDLLKYEGDTAHELLDFSHWVCITTGIILWWLD